MYDALDVGSVIFNRLYDITFIVIFRTDRWLEVMFAFPGENNQGTIRLTRETVKIYEKFSSFI
jgi:hypothetical protein